MRLHHFAQYIITRFVVSEGTPWYITYMNTYNVVHRPTPTIFLRSTSYLTNIRFCISDSAMHSTRMNCLQMAESSCTRVACNCRLIDSGCGIVFERLVKAMISLLSVRVFLLSKEIHKNQLMCCTFT